MVHVYVTSIIGLPDPMEVPEIMAELPEERKEKIQRYKLAEDRKQSLGAGLLLKKALLMHAISADKIIYGENDKPKIEGICFNLSHSHDMVVCAISEKEVGCDVEKIKKVKGKIAEHFFTKNEAAYLQALGEEERQNEFFRIWTLKESYLKMTGEGMKLALNQFEFVFGEGVKVLRNGEICNCFIKEYTLPGYKLSVCAEEAEFAQLQYMPV